MEVPPTLTNLQASRGDKVRFTPDRRKSGGVEVRRFCEDPFLMKVKVLFLRKNAAKVNQHLRATFIGPHLRMQRVDQGGRVKIHGSSFFVIFLII